STTGWLRQNIEEVVAAEEFLSQVAAQMAPLQDAIGDMMACSAMLEDFGCQVPLNQSNQKWLAFGWPQRIQQQCEDTTALLRQSRAHFREEMSSEQASGHAEPKAMFLQDRFSHALQLLELEVSGLGQQEDPNAVDRMARVVRELDAKLTEAEERGRLFNGREALFGGGATDYDQLARVRKAFQPYAQLWATAAEWQQSHLVWTHGAFVGIRAEALEADVTRFAATILKACRYFENSGKSAQSRIANGIKDQIVAFKPKVPIIVALRSPGMRERHWEDLSAKLGYQLMPDESYTLDQLLQLNLEPFQEHINKISESASKEHQIEQALRCMRDAWAGIRLDIVSYKDTGTAVLKGVDEINAVIDEQQVTMTQAMQFSAFKGPFAEQIDTWNTTLCTVSEVLEAWLEVQRGWLYLQPIFESPDINKQLPAEGKQFATVDKSWRGTIASAKANSRAVEVCNNPKLLERFREAAMLLEKVQKGLSDYLETKRSVFARFYFLSNEELLGILSESKEPERVQPHFKKCFEGIDHVTLGAGGVVTHVVSPEGETLPLCQPVTTAGRSVENWLVELEEAMRQAVRAQMERCIRDYVTRDRCQWMQLWPSMCVLNGSQLHWTSETEQLLAARGAGGPRDMLARQLKQLEDMVVLVRGELSSNARTAVGALTVIDVHARDVMIKLVDEKVSDKDDFSWTSQLRYYWEGEGTAGDLWAQMVAARRPYGYEYLGNTFRLVITPLTDKCYLTLMGALQMVLGGAPAGPAGTGKTETTKDLAKALAMQCVVFNCSDGLDYLAMGKFFKGLASCGAWACFDEFNRINIEVLSVIGQQVMTIQLALRAGETRIVFEESDIVVRPGFGVFITMNPGYAGRSDLPDSLKA
ncbi:unnamed protein product, partial [Phaeothamnion confervicola]